MSSHRLTAQDTRFVWVLGLLQLISWGTVFYGFALFMAPLEEALHDRVRGQPCEVCVVPLSPALEEGHGQALPADRQGARAGHLLPCQGWPCRA